MKGEFYKMDYEAWDEGTDELTLEQEAAYLRLCHQLYRRKAAIPSAPTTLARIWRCHPNKARKLLADLVTLGKVTEKDGHLTNTRVTRELDDRETRRTQKADAGHTGGTRTQENRRKSLETNDRDAAPAGTPAKQNQAEREKEVEGEEKEQTEASPPSVTQAGNVFEPGAFLLFWAQYPHKVGKDAAKRSFDIVKRSGRVSLAELLEGLARYKATKPVTREWCHPTTWLNQGRWADQPAPEPTAPSRAAAARQSSADLWAGDAIDAHQSRQRGSHDTLPFDRDHDGTPTAGLSGWHSPEPSAHGRPDGLPAQQPRADARELPPLRLVSRA